MSAPIAVSAIVDGDEQVPPELVSFWQVAEQPSLSIELPSSHCSPASTMLLPHVPDSVWHVDEQPSPLVVLPSSHCSELTSVTPLPQLVSTLHVDEQPSPLVLLPSSHISEPVT
jgi:hypothetical protein